MTWCPQSTGGDEKSFLFWSLSPSGALKKSKTLFCCGTAIWTPLKKNKQTNKQVSYSVILSLPLFSIPEDAGSLGFLMEIFQFPYS